MLLNVAGQLFPERVLHSVMSVFTFMGSSLLRKEDNFSFQVVVQTVDTIIPALLNANVDSRQDSDLDKVCAAVTRVFVDAVFDIPSQRRLPVFCRLVSALGVKKNLWIPIIQLVDVSVLKHIMKDEEKSSGSISPAVQFAISLFAEFAPSVQVNTTLKVLEFLSSLPVNKEEWIKQHSKNEKDTDLQEFLDIRNYSELKLLHFKYTATTLLCYILSSESFLAKIIEVKSKHLPKLELCYRKILECLLLYIQNVSATQAEMLPSNPKLSKKLLHKLYDLLDKVTSLLPSTQFLNVVNLLGDHPLASVRRKALEMLNAKLLNQPKFFKEEDHELLLGMLKPLVKISKGRRRLKETSTHQDQAEEKALNQQTALISILLLSKLLGESHPAPFGKVLGSIAVLFQHQMSAVEHHAPLISNVVLCLAELCSCLRAHALPHLSTFMPPLLELLNNEEILFRNNFLLVSCVTVVQRLVENLSAFLSSYLPVLLMQICCFSSQVSEASSSKMEEEDHNHKHLSVVEQRLNNVRTHISSALPGRVLLPAVEQCYQNMFKEKKHRAISVLMLVLKKRISNFEKSDLTAHLPAMKNFFLTAMDFRNQVQVSGGLPPDVNDIEGQILDAMLTLVLKLSETSFRPFFYQIYEWATQEEEEDANYRIITFYRLTEMMAAKLKTLFVLFANHFVKNSVDILNSNNLAKSESLPWGNDKSGQEQSCQLLDHLLATLHSCFLHDTQHTLVEEECFKSLSQPLVDQLENVLGGEEKYQERVTNLLSPCLAQLAIAAADDSCWKPYQYQILLKTRHADAKIRFAALKSLQEFATKLGDDYVTLLPEAIPFLAELLEDESTEVEQQCQEVLSKMEQIVGEPLKKYF